MTGRAGNFRCVEQKKSAPISSPALVHLTFILFYSHLLFSGVNSRSCFFKGGHYESQVWPRLSYLDYLLGDPDGDGMSVLCSELYPPSYQRTYFTCF